MAVINVAMGNTQLWQCVVGVSATPRVLEALFEATRQHLAHTRRAWTALLAFIECCSSGGWNDYREDYAQLKALLESSQGGEE